jgi:hypothetical protein
MWNLGFAVPSWNEGKRAHIDISSDSFSSYKVKEGLTLVRERPGEEGFPWWEGPLTTRKVEAWGGGRPSHHGKPDEPGSPLA